MGADGTEEPDSGGRTALIVGYGLASVGAVLFSTKAIFAKLAYAIDPNPELLLAWRMLLSLPMFVATGLLAAGGTGLVERLLAERRTVGAAVLTGLIGYYLASLLDFMGLVYITAQLERLVLFTYPIFVMLLGRLFFGMRLTAGGLAAAALAYVGLAIVFNEGFAAGGSDVVTGSLLVLGSAISFALYQLLAKGFIARLGSTLFTSIALSSAAIACIIHYIVVSGSLDFTAPPEFLALALATAVFATVLPSYLVNAGLGRIGPQATGMISAMGPIFTVGLAVWILGERFTLIDAIGTMLVVGGIGLYTWLDMRRARRP
ncbi:MAG: DMT family transporter [Parvibaculaceae bacterium]